MCGRKPAPVLVAHADAHYSVTRSAGILGLGTDQIVSAALDDRRRIDPNRLDETLRDLRSRGVPIVAVSAASCATPIGAFDPLIEIADVCRRHDVWLHVDAAHGGALAFSPRHRHLLAGIELADSVVCDAHKMMFMPGALRDALLRTATIDSRPSTRKRRTCSIRPRPSLAEYDSGLVNLECTKRAAAFGVWGVWSLFGPQIFADMVDVTIDLAQQFHAMLDAADDFEPLHEPQCNIVAFRYLPHELRDAPPEANRCLPTAVAAGGDRIGRVLSGAKPHRRPTRPADHDDESANHGRRSPRPVRLPAAATASACQRQAASGAICPASSSS